MVVLVIWVAAGVSLLHLEHVDGLYMVVDMIIGVGYVLGVILVWYCLWQIRGVVIKFIHIVIWNYLFCIIVI